MYDVDLTAYEKLYRQARGADFLNSFDGQVALAKFNAAQRKFIMDDRDAKAVVQRRSALIRAVLREPPPKSHVTPNRETVLTTLGERKRRATHPSEVPRLMKRNKSICDAFHFRVKTILEAGEIIDPPKDETPEQYEARLSDERIDARYQNQLDRASRKIALEASKHFKTEDIPMALDVVGQSLYFDLAGCWVNPLERVYVDQVFSAAAEKYGFRWIPQPDVNRLQYGHVVLNVSEKALTERFPVHYI